MTMSPYLKYPLYAFAVVMSLGFMSVVGKEYRPGLEIKTPLFTDHFIELR
jgi:hypothetical protein